MNDATRSVFDDVKRGFLFAIGGFLFWWMVEATDKEEEDVAEEIEEE